MVIELVKMQLKRLNRLKLIYLFFIVMAAFIISNLSGCIGDLEDAGMGYYSGGRFLTLCMQSYVDIIGPLFISFICAILISGEKGSGMFRQPLLNGITKRQLLLAKISGTLIVSFICFLFVILFSTGTGFLFWGNRVFDNIHHCLLQILLLSIPQITMSLFFVFLSLYMSNISGMMCISLIILLINNLFSQFFGRYILFMDFMYYLYAFSEYNGMVLNANTIAAGLIVNAITIPVLICGMMKRLKYMAV